MAILSMKMRYDACMYGNLEPIGLSSFPLKKKDTWRYSLYDFSCFFHELCFPLFSHKWPAQLSFKSGGVDARLKGLALL